jgi:hypothetical protein
VKRVQLFPTRKKVLKITSDYKIESSLKMKQIFFQLLEVISELLKLIFESNQIMFENEKLFFQLLELSEVVNLIFILIPLKNNHISDLQYNHTAL